MSYKIFQRLCPLSVVLLMSCHTWDIDHDTALDPVTKMTRQEIEQNLLKPTQPPQHKPKRTIISKNPAILPKCYETLVTLSTTESVPLKDVFFQMARQAKINLSVDPGVKGGASLQVIDRPLIDVIREVCAVNHLRYRLDNGILRIEPDQPYLQNYNVQFLSLKRENKNQISITSDILNGSSQGTDGLTGGGNNGSNTVLTGETKNNFWQELEHTLKTILKNNGNDDTKSSFSIHKQAGIVSIHATQAQQHQVEQFIHMLRLSMSSQVLIEAKIVEVTLNDKFKTGINWNLLKGDLVLQAPFGDLVSSGKFDRKALPAHDVITLGGSGSQLTELVSLMNKFGSVRTLSSPRLSAMNNEPGFMEVATNFVYFTIDYNRDYGFNFAREHESISSKVQTVPIGLVMVVQPSINSEDGSVTLSLKLMLSRMINSKKAPSIDGRVINQDSYVPEVQGRVFDSLVHLKSGGTVIMGGLMEEFALNNQSGVPGLMDIPVFGHLAKSQADDRHITELVIFLKVTIVDDEGDVAVKSSSVNPTDMHLYETFIKDPRPLFPSPLSPIVPDHKIR